MRSNVYIFKHFPLSGDAFSFFFKLMFPPTSTVLVNVLTIFESDNWVDAQKVWMRSDFHTITVGTSTKLQREQKTKTFVIIASHPAGRVTTVYSTHSCTRMSPFFLTVVPAACGQPTVTS